MKIYISADIEGVTGVTHEDQTGGSSADYMQARKWMTAEVNAAIEGAQRGAGISEFYVKDAHGNGRNILLDELKQEARLMAGWDAMMSMVQGIDDSFDALILIGYHSMAGTENGILAHTFSGSVKQLSINDRPIGESEISALTAGHYGVPVVFIAGDQTVVKEFESFVGEIPHAITKYGTGRESGQVIHPEITYHAITDGAGKALANISNFKPFTMETPLRMSVKLSSSAAVDLISLMPNVDKISADEVACQVEDPIAMHKMFRVMMGLTWSLK